MLWFIAIPLLDCIGLIFSRIKKGKSWSTAGRDHIHHKLMQKFSSKVVLAVILFVTLFTGLFGIFIENIAATFISTILFFLYGMVYYILFGFIKTNIVKNAK